MRISSRIGGVGLAIGLCSGLLATLAANAEVTQIVKVRDALRLVTLSNPRFSVDGRWIALVISDTDDFRVPITQPFGLYRALQDKHV